LKNKRLWLFSKIDYGVLLAVSLLAFLSQFFPLTSVFSYEYSALFALILFFASAIVTLQNATIGKNKILYLFLLFLVPFFIAGFTNLFSGACPFAPGIKFYLLITFPALLLGTATGIFSASLTKGKIKRTALVLFFFLLFAGVNIVEFYLYPQVYFFNQIILFFPGTVYDPLIKITPEWLFYRFFTFIFVGFLFYLSRFKRRGFTRFMIFTFVFLLFVALKPRLHFATDEQRLTGILNKKTESKHFLFFMDSTIASNKAEYFVNSAEFFYNELKSKLNLTPEKKVTVFLFANSEQKARFFGSRNADVAKIWLRQIYVEQKAFDSNFEHELAHIFSRGLGKGIFKMPAGYNPGLLEGFATALTDNFDESEIDYPAALDFRITRKMPLPELFQGFSFYSLSSVKAYGYAGSFMKYLKDKFGTDKMKKIYSTGEFRAVYGVTLDSLVKGYKAFLSNLTVQADSGSWLIYFGRTPVIKRYCFRTVAEQREHAKELLRKGDLKNAEKIYSDLWNITGDARDLLTLVRTDFALGKFQVALEKISENSRKYRTSADFSFLQLEKAKIVQALGLKNGAKKLLKKLESMKIHPNITLRAGARLRLLKMNILADTLAEGKKQELFNELVFREKDSRFIFSLLGFLAGTERCEVLTKFTDSLDSLMYLDSYHLLKLARMCEKHLKWREAKKLLAKALKINNFSFRKKILLDEIKKVNFLENHLSDL